MLASFSINSRSCNTVSRAAGTNLRGKSAVSPILVEDSSHTSTTLTLIMYVTDSENDIMKSNCGLITEQMLYHISYPDE